MSKADTTKRRILLCAFEQIQKNGYESVKITDICRDAKVSPSTFYIYFPTKDSLVSTYYDENINFEPSDFTSILQQDTPWDQLWRAHELYCEKMESVGKEMCRQLQQLQSTKSNIYTKHKSILEPLMGKALVAGEIRIETDAKSLYRCSCYLMSGLYSTWANSDEDYNLKDEVRKALEIFYNLPSHLRKSC